MSSLDPPRPDDALSWVALFNERALELIAFFERCPQVDSFCYHIGLSLTATRPVGDPTRSAAPAARVRSHLIVSLEKRNDPALSTGPAIHPPSALSALRLGFERQMALEMLSCWPEPLTRRLADSVLSRPLGPSESFEPRALSMLSAELVAQWQRQALELQTPASALRARRSL